MARKQFARGRARGEESPPAPPVTPYPGVPGSAPPLSPRLVGRLSSAMRKQYPMCSGLVDYFPDALAEVAHISFLGNEKHNPGEPLHWARGKSMDHADCVARHLSERGLFEVIDLNGMPTTVRHTAQLAWRALALLQEELEAEYGLDKPRSATDLPQR